MKSNILLPETGFVRLPQVLAVFPVSRSVFWAGVKSGKYPKPVKLSARCTAWLVVVFAILVFKEDFEKVLLIIQFIRVIAWPAVVIFAILFFKNDFKKALKRLKKGKFLGGNEVEFDSEG